MMRILKTAARITGRTLIGCERILIAGMLMLGLSAYGLANYNFTQGAGTAFGSVVIGGVHYAALLVCDFATANQCAAVKPASTPAATTDPALVVQNAQEHIDLTSATPAGSNRTGFVTLQADTTGGCTPGHILTAASNNATQIKASAGTLCEVTFLNTTTSLFDIRFYDTATAPAAGAPCNATTNAVANYVAQSNATSPGFTIEFGAYGKTFVNGIVVCITGANADNDNTNAVTGGNLNYGFK